MAESLKILGYHSCLSSTLLLRDKIEELCNRHFIVSRKSVNVQEGVIIRYGNDCGVQGVDTEYNAPNFISMCVNKLVTSNFLTKNDILTPIFHRSEPSKKDFPLIVRKTLSGCYGEGIVVCETMEEFNNIWNNEYYWTSYISVDYEIRAYIFGGELIGLFVKKPFSHQEGDKLAIRSEYHFSVRNNLEGKYTTLKRIAKKIANVSEGRFFGMDAGYSSNLGGYIVFELNSGPWLNDSLAGKLAQYLVRELNL